MSSERCVRVSLVCACLLATAAIALAEPHDPLAVDAVEAGPFSSAQPAGPLPEGWRPHRFDSIDRGTDYRLVDRGGRVVVEAASAQGASGLTRDLEVDLARHPWLEWSWRVEKVYAKGDVHTKDGDDYPARIYVAFAFDPERATWTERVQWEALRVLHGRYPPKVVLNYIWANRAPVGTVVPNPYSRRAMMVVVDSGAAYVGAWRHHARNVAADYEQIFGEPPPRVSGVAIMTDSDDTGESARAWFGDLRFRAGPPEEALEVPVLNPPIRLEK